MVKLRHVPSHQHRRLRAPKPPLGVVLSYQETLGRWLRGWFATVLATVLDGWEDNPAHYPGTVRDKKRGDNRFDASDYVTQKLGPLRVALEQAFAPGSPMSRDIRILAARVNKKGDLEFRRTIGISPRGDLGTGAALDQFRDANIAKIKSLVDQQLDEIQDLLEVGEVEGKRVEVLRKEIQDRFGVTKSKADLLARDQVLKLNGDLTKVRQEGVGITHYIWTTSHDERVRGTPGGVNPKGLHYELDGTIHAWTTPPVCSLDGRREHPGGDYQCRCTAFPILPELVDTSED